MEERKKEFEKLKKEAVSQEAVSKTPIKDAKKDSKETPIMVVSLDIQLQDSNYKKYEKLPVLEKIQRIEKRIIEIYNEIQKKSPEAWVVISWREFGISDPTEKSIDGNGKDSPKIKLKEMLQRVTKTCPHLEVISGPTLVRKTVTKEKLIKTKEFYKQHEWIEKKEAGKSEIQMQIHREVIDKLEKENKAGPYIQYKTISYAVIGGEILRHGKISPYNESKDFAGNPLSFYQPGKSRSYNPLFEFKNEKVPRLGLEICYENWHATLHHYSKKMGKKPDLQLVLSASTFVNIESVIAKYGLIHIDAFFPTQHIILHENQTLDRSILVYRCNLLSPDTILEGPIKPVIPLQYQMKDFIDSLAKKWDKEKKAPSQMAQLNKLSNIIDNYNEQCKTFYPGKKSLLQSLLSELRAEKADYEEDGEAELENLALALITMIETFHKKYDMYIMADEDLLQKSDDEQENPDEEENKQQESLSKERKDSQEDLYEEQGEQESRVITFSSDDSQPQIQIPPKPSKKK